MKVGSSFEGVRKVAKGAANDKYDIVVDFELADDDLTKFWGTELRAIFV